MDWIRTCRWESFISFFGGRILSRECRQKRRHFWSLGTLWNMYCVPLIAYSCGFICLIWPFVQRSCINIYWKPWRCSIISFPMEDLSSITTILLGGTMRQDGGPFTKSWILFFIVALFGDPMSTSSCSICFGLGTPYRCPACKIP